jgi:hypothetical protein
MGEELGVGSEEAFLTTKGSRKTQGAQRFF